MKPEIVLIIIIVFLGICVMIAYVHRNIQQLNVKIAENEARTPQYKPTGDAVENIEPQRTPTEIVDWTAHLNGNWKEDL